jgi:hypothetical protein
MKGLLTGGLQKTIGQAFGKTFQPGRLHLVTSTPNGQGGYVRSETAVPIRGLVLRYSHDYRTRWGIPDTDVSLIIFQHGVRAEMTMDNEVTLQGTRWRMVGPIEQDPAQATWTVRARPV